MDGDEEASRTGSCLRSGRSKRICPGSDPSRHKTKPLPEVTRTQLFRDSTRSGGRWRSCRSAWGSSPSDSCAIGFIEIAADLESLEMVSATRAESIGFSPDGRPPLIPSLIRTAAWDERCGGIEETCTLSTGSADAGHARVGLPVAKARSAKKTAKRWAPGGVAASSEAPMPSRSFRPQYSLRGRTCWQARRSSGAAPTPTPCTSGHDGDA